MDDSSSSNLETNYLYTGQQYDSATELYSLRARKYDPSDGRFLTRDTWAYDYANPYELNRYVYTSNNPATYVDPSGYIIESVKTRLSAIAASPAFKAAGVTLRIWKARAIIYTFRLTPYVSALLCTIAGVASDADVPGCANIDIPTIPRFKLTRTTVDSSNAFVQAAEHVRTFLSNSNQRGKNIAILDYTIDGTWTSRLWGVSGNVIANGNSSQKATFNVQNILNRLGQAVAPITDSRIFQTIRDGRGRQLALSKHI